MKKLLLAIISFLPVVVVSQTERQILEALYDSTNGDSWKDNTNWNTEQPICSWFGIFCEEGSSNGDHGVIRIYLDYNNLNGNLPPELWKLESLNHVHFRGNLLQSASFGDLYTSDAKKDARSPIEVIVMSENHLTSLEGIGNAKQTLKELNLNKNQIDGQLPTELFDLTNLKTLFLGFNQIAGTIPTLIGRLTRLTEVFAFDNRLTGTIPSEFGLLDNCQMLGLGDNKITGTLPTELNQMVNMRDLSIHHVVSAGSEPQTTGITGPLLTFGDMPFLSLLSLDGNTLSGTIPSDFLRHNNNTNDLLTVGLSHNRITGGIPKALERFESITIDLAGNQITDIPPELCEKGGWMGGLVEEYKCDAIMCAKGSYSIQGRTMADGRRCEPCSDNSPYLGSTSCSSSASSQRDWVVLADFYTEMAGMKWKFRNGWDVFDALFDGDTVEDLESLNIDVCDDWYGVRCENGKITQILLPQNELFGLVSDTLFKLPSLQRLDLSDNNIQIENLHVAARAKYLTSLVLSNTKLESLDGIEQMAGLEQLYLDGLSIQEPLPGEIFELTLLKTLHLQHGSFSGTLPTLIGHLTKLSSFNIYGNSLTGQLPTELGSLIPLNSLDLSENDFAGTLPEELSSLSKLTVFAIHQVGGKLGGPLPRFDTFANLKELNLESNSFSGSIPEGFLSGVTDKTTEITISLGFNQLTGTVPKSLDEFERLILNLEANQISGIPPRLCENDHWMGGEVGRMEDESRCNAILCPPGTWNEFGKETEKARCNPCAENAILYGQVECSGNERNWEKKILDKLFSMTGGRYWNKTHDNWQKPGVPICEREGVHCFNQSANEGVRELQMNAFGLRGTIPTDIWKLTSARLLSFTNNAVDVSFDGIEEAKSLIVLKLSNCNLRTLDGLGVAPKTLKELHVAANQFDGKIPHGIYELDSVVKLFLNNNHFSGRIPSEMGLLTAVTELFLQNNRLTGMLPSELGLITNLASLSVSQNELSGLIPREIQNLQQLSRLEIAQQKGNQFNGPLPAFDESPLLAYLDASENSFSGYLPPYFLSQVNVGEKIFVNLSQNRLEGPVPVYWSKFESLNIDLSGNLLTGLPEALCQNNDWNNGLVGLLGTCDAILCPPGTHLEDGRQTSVTTSCQSCPGGEDSAPYFGTRECIDPKFLKERKILVDFYSASNGTNWLVQTNWLSNYPTCSWYGVKCNEDGFVEELTLENNKLESGSTNIVSKLFSLEDLKVLDLKSNNVELDFQQIPADSKLEFLRLSGTGLRSLDGISKAAELRALHVTNNNIHNIPDELFEMRNVESLFLSFNSITGTISPRIGSLSNLQELYLFRNQLRGSIPSHIGLLSSLTDFFVADNFLSGHLPDELSSLPSLEQLSVSHQQGLDLITGQVPSFSGAPKLRYFDASDNDLTGPLPDNFMMNSVVAKEPVSVYLQNNEITGTVPSELLKFDSLDIHLAGNEILEIPEPLCKIDDWMQGNAKLIGNCSAILCPSGTFNQYGYQTPGNPCLSCSHLKDVAYLGQTRCESFTSERDTLINLFESTGGEFWKNNKFWHSDDPICTWSGLLCEDGDLQDTHGITSIMLDGNGLSGILPSDVWTLPSLRSLSVNGNPNLVVRFEGLENAADTIEALYLSGVQMVSLSGISAAISLKELDITGNELKGTFPEELLALRDSLEGLFIGDNLFNGPIPTRLGKMKRLKTFDAFDNEFLSTIPSELGRLQSLRTLVLAENLLYGQIPEEVSAMPTLEVFSAFRHFKSGPRLSGSLPSFGKAPQLRVLHLEGNEIQGPIPQDFVRSSQSVETIGLSSNYLTGDVPEDLGSISNLILELDGNQIESFPSSFCDRDDWMDGSIMDYKCDGFLCPPGTSSPRGRAINSSNLCQSCESQGMAPFYGSISCDGRQTEREILVNLYHALKGDDWFRNDFWGSTTDICNWYGIGCLGGHVVIINLRGNNLQGLPGPDLFHLSELKILWLYSNPITFSFENIGSAKKLQDLNLDSTNIHTLHGIGAASSLVSFSARFTAIRGKLPADLLQLINLRILSLEANKLTGTLPTSFASLRYLVSLRMNSNQLSGKLPAFDDLHFLREVDMSDNTLSGPISRTFLQKISTDSSPIIKLSENQLTGVIPEEFDRFSDITLLLAGNQILGLPRHLCDNNNWNGGDVGDFGCDAILCKPGTFNEVGRSRRSGSRCRSCGSALYYGETVCADASSAFRLLSYFSRGVWVVCLSFISLNGVW